MLVVFFRSLVYNNIIFIEPWYSNEWKLINRYSREKIHNIVEVSALTDHLQITDLTDHRVGVNLTHVNALVRRSHAVDVQHPHILAIVRHAESGYSGDHMFVHCNYHLPINVDPGNLQVIILLCTTI